MFRVLSLFLVALAIFPTSVSMGYGGGPLIEEFIFRPPRPPIPPSNRPSGSEVLTGKSPLTPQLQLQSQDLANTANTLSRLGAAHAFDARQKNGAIEGHASGVDLLEGLSPRVHVQDLDHPTPNLSHLQLRYKELLRTLSPDARSAVDEQVQQFLNTHTQEEHQRFFKILNDDIFTDYVRSKRRTITQDALTEAIQATPDKAFSSQEDLISGIANAIEVQSNAKPSRYELNIASGELTFPYEKDISGFKVKIGSVNVYKTLKFILKVAGAGAIVSCLESNDTKGSSSAGNEACEQLVAVARNLLISILNSDSTAKQIGG